MDKKKKLNNKKYFIKVKKNIPQKSGMGGGSMNASSILRYFLANKKIALTSKEIIKITSKIGSDVIIGMQKGPSIIFGNDFSFIGFDVVKNLEQVLKIIGKNNLVGLFTLAILSWIIVRKR